MQAVDGVEAGGKASAKLIALLVVERLGGAVVGEVGGKEAVAAKHPIAIHDEIDENAFDHAHGLEIAIILGDEGGKRAGIFPAGGFAIGINTGLDGLHS